VYISSNKIVFVYSYQANNESMNTCFSTSSHNHHSSTSIRVDTTQRVGLKRSYAHEEWPSQQPLPPKYKTVLFSVLRLNQCISLEVSI